MYLKDRNVKRDPFWSQFFLVMDMRHGHADGKQRYQTQGEKHGTDDIFCRWPTSPHMFCPTALGCSAYIICSTGVDLGVKSIGFKSESGSSYSCDLRNEKYLLEHQHIHLLKMGLGKTCEPKAFSFQCMTEFTTKKKRILEWVAISFSRGSSQPRDQTWVSCIVGRFFTV